ncbi:MAG TPA: Rieske 2Fe-2S domain-containing protein, partial [Opitutus sp.]|nr:Rieske 2Fe-2S domain-containing protein [Opitutus sp.]
PIVVSLVGLGLLGYSGYLGGDLVYSNGIAVGRHRRETSLPRATIEAGSARDEGWRPIADEQALAEGATLRVDVDGTIVVLARIKGKVHAFQEFCTHRYGPLSEGAFQGNDVICPWHCSRFDVRTGKVTAGPAKVDLRTFRIATRAGKIWIENLNTKGAS